MQRLQTIRSRRKLRFAGPKELLKSAIDQLRNLTADHHPRPHSRAQTSLVLYLFEHYRAAILADPPLVCDPRNILNIELKTAQFAENFGPRALARLFEHGGWFPGNRATRYTEQ